MWDLQELSGCYSVKQVEEKSTFNKPDSSLFVCFFFLHCCFFLWQLHWKQIRASMCLQSLLPLSIYSLKLNMSPVCRSSYLHKALVNKPDVLMYLENKEMFFPSLLLKLECWWKKKCNRTVHKKKATWGNTACFYIHLSKYSAGMICHTGKHGFLQSRSYKETA